MTGVRGSAGGAFERKGGMALGFLKKLATYVGAKSAGAILPHVARRPELLARLVDGLIEKGVQNVKEKGEFPPKMEERKIAAIRMVGEMIKKHLPRLAPGVQRKLVFNLLYHQLTHGEPIRDKYHERYGEWPPTFFAVSPSMRCNLRCEGCYAAEYERYGELTRDEFIEIVRQGKEDFGIHFYTVLGGEPTFWPPMWECCEAHPDVYFQVYTHGQLIDAELAKRVANLGNVLFAISIEGTKEDTDRRRGPGTYDRIMKAMDHLADAGVLYGFSATHTRKNHESLVRGDFYERMLEKGCAFGWVFQYVPMGRDPDMELVVTPEERLERANAIYEFRERHPIAIFDFWNDGEMTDGCMAWGRRYVHVLSNGNVEPCVFVHFTKHNIRETSLLDILQSDFMREARKRAPFYCDRRAPCSFLDNPEFIREMVEKHDLRPSHPGAESIVCELQGPLMEMSSRYKRMLAELDEKQEEAPAVAK
jgi:MoaA/NifB/PqqE/SkfB family radical SAM enzyme